MLHMLVVYYHYSNKEYPMDTFHIFGLSYSNKEYYLMDMFCMLNHPNEE